MRQAYGFIETVGLAAAIEASDIALKSADVELIGLELTRGYGYTTVKLEGSVSSINASINSAKGSEKLIGKIVSTDIIPRPSKDLDLIVLSGDNLKLDKIGDNGVTKKVKEDIEEKIEVNEDKEASIEEDTEEKIEVNVDEEASIEGDTEEKIAVNEDKEASIEEDTEEKVEYTCNLCEDPKCERHKGEPRKTCIHYNES